MLYMEKKLPPNLGEFSTALLINAIYRRTNDAISQERSALNCWIPTATRQRRTDPATIDEGWPPSSQLSSKWRNSACDSLDVLHWSANSKTMRPQWSRASNDPAPPSGKADYIDPHGTYPGTRNPFVIASDRL